jgi:hypothetical protein
MKGNNLGARFAPVALIIWNPPCLSRFSRDSAAGAGEEEEVGLARTQNALNPAGEGVRKKLDHLEM